MNAYKALVQTLELYGGSLAQDVTVPAGLYLVRAEVNGPATTRAFTERLTVVK